MHSTSHLKHKTEVIAPNMISVATPTKN